MLTFYGAQKVYHFNQLLLNRNALLKMKKMVRFKLDQNILLIWHDILLTTCYYDEYYDQFTSVIEFPLYYTIGIFIDLIQLDKIKDIKSDWIYFIVYTDTDKKSHLIYL